MKVFISCILAHEDYMPRFADTYCVSDSWPPTMEWLEDVKRGIGEQCDLENPCTVVITSMIPLAEN